MSALVIGRDLALPGRLAPTSLCLAAGELVCLIGPNGSGKTSLLHALAGIGRPGGTVHIAGSDVRRGTPAERSRLLSFLPATREIAWPVAARDLIALGLPLNVADTTIAAVLTQLGAASLANRRMDRLSTGERSRVLIARALAPAPKLLLLDEPTANLDPLWQLRLMEDLRAITQGSARAVVVAMHDIDTALRYADRLLIMAQGGIAADGSPAALVEADHIGRIFGICRANGYWQPIRPPEGPRSSR